MQRSAALRSVADWGASLWLQEIMYRCITLCKAAVEVRTPGPQRAVQLRSGPRCPSPLHCIGR